MTHKTHVALVTTFPPSLGSLNEYAFHFVRALRGKIDEVRKITLLVEKLPAEMAYEFSEGGVEIEAIPCWSFNRVDNPLRILKAVKNVQPDIVLFNIQFASFGDKKASAAIGLMTPWMLKQAGFKTVVLLHNIMETVDLNSAGFANNIIMSTLIRTFGRIATQFILAADLVVLTIPKYIKILQSEYGAENVLLAPHGTFEIPPLPNFKANQGPKQVMTFGKFGTYKRVEKLIEAVAQLRAGDFPDLELVIAGTDNPNAKGYLDNVRETYGEQSWITYTGYVAEEDVPRIFGDSTVVVFPYTSTTGSSGVLHQAGSYGKPAVLPNLGDFAELISDEGYTGEFFEPGDADSMARALARILGNDQNRRQIAEQNYHAACGLPISDVVDWYLIYFDQLLATNYPQSPVAISQSGDVKIISLSGRLDSRTAQLLAIELARATKKSQSYIFDMQDVGFVDQEGLAILRQLAVQTSGRLHLCHVRQPVRIIFEMMTGYGEFRFYNTASEAKKAFSDDYESIAGGMVAADAFAFEIV